MTGPNSVDHHPINAAPAPSPTNDEKIKVCCQELVKYSLKGDVEAVHKLLAETKAKGIKIDIDAKVPIGIKEGKSIFLSPRIAAYAMANTRVLRLLLSVPNQQYLDSKQAAEMVEKDLGTDPTDFPYDLNQGGHIIPTTTNYKQWLNNVKNLGKFADAKADSSLGMVVLAGTIDKALEHLSKLENCKAIRDELQNRRDECKRILDSSMVTYTATSSISSAHAPRRASRTRAPRDRQFLNDRSSSRSVPPASSSPKPPVPPRPHRYTAPYSDEDTNKVTTNASRPPVPPKPPLLSTLHSQRGIKQTFTNSSSRTPPPTTPRALTHPTTTSSSAVPLTSLIRTETFNTSRSRSLSPTVHQADNNAAVKASSSALSSRRAGNTPLTLATPTGQRVTIFASSDGPNAINVSRSRPASPTDHKAFTNAAPASSSSISRGVACPPTKSQNVKLDLPKLKATESKEKDSPIKVKY